MDLSLYHHLHVVPFGTANPNLTLTLNSNPNPNHGVILQEINFLGDMLA